MVGDSVSVLMMMVDLVNLEELLVGLEVGVVGEEARVLERKEIFGRGEEERGLLLETALVEMRNLVMVLMIITLNGRFLGLVEVWGLVKEGEDLVAEI